MGKPAISWSAPPALALHFAATPLAVREGLDAILADPLMADLPPDCRGTVWTVLAEVLNNVVEHAYAQSPASGGIDLRLWRTCPGLALQVLDRGAPMPGLRLPEGKLAEIGGFDDLPEGGFGWSLIRALTSDLVYDRLGAGNRLRFCIPCG